MPLGAVLVLGQGRERAAVGVQRKMSAPDDAAAEDEEAPRGQAGEEDSGQEQVRPPTLRFEAQATLVSQVGAAASAAKESLLRELKGGERGACRCAIQVCKGEGSWSISNDSWRFVQLTSLGIVKLTKIHNSSIHASFESRE